MKMTGGDSERLVVSMLSVLVVLSQLSTVHNFGFSSESHESLVTQGKIQYEVISLDSKMPRYGQCWKNALHDLTTGCRNLDDEVQSRLALSFANCFLEKAGLRTYKCDADQPISECVKNIEINAYTTFSNFFTHTQNMCYFLQSQVWQEETDRTVERLAQNSDLVSQSMEETHQLQSRILESQHLTIEYQRQLMENSSFLSQALQTSKDNVKQMLAEFKHSTDEQRNLIFEVFDRVSHLQNLVISEVNWLYTIVFYAACLLVIYIVTATKRTADARLALFIILSLNLVAERLVCAYTLPEDSNKVPRDVSELVYSQIWQVRKLAIAICAIVLVVFIVRFKDYNLINNTLLQEIKRQNLELKESMQVFQVRNRMSYQAESGDVLDGKVPQYDAALSVLLSENTGFEGDEDEYDTSDSDDDSFNSTRTDASYDPSTWPDEQFETAANSRDNSGDITPTNEIIDAALESDAGSRLAGVFSRIQEFTTPIKQDRVTPLKRSRGRPRKSPSPAPASEQTPLRFSTPRTSAGGGAGRGGGSAGSVRRITPDPERYNLRSRTPRRSFSPVSEETPEDFAKAVRAQHSITKRNYSKWKMAVKKQEDTTGYSSDDETG